MTLVSIRTKRLEVLVIACASPLASNLIFVSENNKEVAHKTRHLARGGVVCTQLKAVCGDMSGLEPGGGIRIRHYWCWWHDRTSKKEVDAQTQCQ